MIGTVRGVFTLVGAGAAGLLVWVSTQIGQGTVGGYWAVYGILAGAGLTMALSQLFGGWTKWGWPRISGGVFLFGFLPVLVAVLWVLAAGQPEANWGQRHVTSWSGDISILGLVDDLRLYPGVLAFGLGLVFGFTFDTSGPRRPREPVPAGPVYAEPEPVEPTSRPSRPSARRCRPRPCLRLRSRSGNPRRNRSKSGSPRVRDNAPGSPGRYRPRHERVRRHSSPRYRSPARALRYRRAATRPRAAARRAGPRSLPAPRRDARDRPSARCAAAGLVLAVEPHVQEDRTRGDGGDDRRGRAGDADALHEEPEEPGEHDCPDERDDAVVDAGRSQVHRRSIVTGPEIRRAGSAFVHRIRRPFPCGSCRPTRLRSTRAPCSAQAAT